MFEGPGAKCRGQQLEIRQQHIARLAQLEGQRGVEHIRRRQAEVQPPG